MYALRGAISVESNSEEAISKATKKLMNKVMEENNIDKSDLVSIITSATDDLDKVYPGKAIREIGYNLTPILCLQEMKVENSSGKMIRLLLHVMGDRDNKNLNHQYLKKARKLRPDLIE